MYLSSMATSDPGVLLYILFIICIGRSWSRHDHADDISQKDLVLSLFFVF